MRRFLLVESYSPMLEEKLPAANRPEWSGLNDSEEMIPAFGESDAWSNGIIADHVEECLPFWPCRLDLEGEVCIRTPCSPSAEMSKISIAFSKPQYNL